jgi:F0F1-type ATP synthase membrane subunit c/vacuolar-type H+-ATPase subunit K
MKISQPEFSKFGVVLLDVRKIFFLHLLIIGSLLVAYALTCVLRIGFGKDFANGLVPFFNLDAENSLPAFVATFGWVALSLSFYLNSRKEMDPPTRIGWLLVAAVSFFLAVDEGASFHEKFIYFFKDIGVEELSIIGFRSIYFTTLIYLLILLSLLFIVKNKILRLISSMQMKNHFILAAAAVLFVLGAVGVELFGGGNVAMKLENLRKADVIDPSAMRALQIKMAIFVAIEEGLELLGVAFALFASLRELAGPEDKLTITIARQ